MMPDDAASSHLVSDEGIQLNSVGSDSFRQDTSIASQNRQNSLLDSSPSRRQGSPSLVGFSLRPSPRRNLANSPSRPESQPAFTNHQVQQSGIFQSVFGFFSNFKSQGASPASSLSCSRSYFGGYRRSYTAYPGPSWGGETLTRSSRLGISKILNQVSLYFKSIGILDHGSV